MALTEEQKANQREYRRLKRERGDCVDCSEPTFKGGRCEKHYEQQQERVKNLRKTKREGGECRDCSEPTFKAGLCEKHYEKQLERIAKHRQKTRVAIFNHYGNECAHCGSTENLELDHINNDGKIHREREGIETGTDTYYWIVRNRFPEGFQILCKSCNLRKHHEHRRQQGELVVAV